MQKLLEIRKKKSLADSRMKDQELVLRGNGSDGGGEIPSSEGSLGGDAHGPRQPTTGKPRLLSPCGRPRPAFLWVFLALPDTRSQQASILSLPTSISSCKRKEQNRKCLRQNAPWVDERKQRVGLHRPPPPRGFQVGPMAWALRLLALRCRGSVSGGGGS